MKTKFFGLCNKIALKSSSRFRLSCVIAKKNKVVSFGWNDMSKTNPKCKTYGHFLHAEIRALLKANPLELKGSTAYVYRLRRDGKIGKARPCSVCLQALKLAEIRRVCYTDKEGYSEEMI